MPTKYVDVDGYAVNYFHTGRTTLPNVAPDTSKGKVRRQEYLSGTMDDQGKVPTC